MNKILLIDVRRECQACGTYFNTELEYDTESGRSNMVDSSCPDCNTTIAMNIDGVSEKGINNTPSVDKET